MKAVTFFKRSSVKNKIKDVVRHALPQVARSSRSATDMLSGCVTTNV